MPPAYWNDYFIVPQLHTFSIERWAPSSKKLKIACHVNKLHLPLRFEHNEMMMIDMPGPWSNLDQANLTFFSLFRFVRLSLCSNSCDWNISLPCGPNGFWKICMLRGSGSLQEPPAHSERIADFSWNGIKFRATAVVVIRLARSCGFK